MTRRQKHNQSELPALCTAAEAAGPTPRISKLTTLIALLQSEDGVPLAALCEVTGWQGHSVRGAMAGTLRRKGYAITSLKPEDGHRRYRIKGVA